MDAVTRRRPHVIRMRERRTTPVSIVTIAEEIARAREHVLPGREAAATNERN
jgi:hypothetical protein